MPILLPFTVMLSYKGFQNNAEDSSEKYESPFPCHYGITTGKSVPSYTAEDKKKTNQRLIFYSIDRINKRQLLKTLWEKKKCLQRAISSFPTMFSTQSENCIPICQYF